MVMHEVVSAQDKADFIEVANAIYKNDPQWIRPLDKDIEEVFDVNKNKFFKTGECKRWILKDNSGKHIGRIAAFHTSKYKNEQPTGGVGFFECNNDKAAAHFMFDYCKQWLQDRGMQAMDGPINFGERERWWGLLIEGFYSPLYCMNYNPPYYRELFESYGFQVYFNQLCFGLTASNRLQEKFYQRHDAIAADKNFSARTIEKKNLSKYAKDFTYVYNKAWAGHGGGKSLDERQVQKMFATMKPVMDEKIIWFAYHKEEPVAMWINLPDLNQYFKHLNGKFGILQKIQFLYHQRFGKCNRFVGLVFGVIPEFQGKGVDAYIIVEGAEKIIPLGKYDNYEMQWIGDFNPKMVNIAEALGTHRSRTLATYRFLFDRNAEFQRHPMIGGKKTEATNEN